MFCMSRTFKKFTTAAALVFLGAGAAAFAGDLVLWYQQPVGSAINEALSAAEAAPPLGLAGGKASPFINEALPIGNGRLGGLIAGGTAPPPGALHEDRPGGGGQKPRGDGKPGGGE